VKEGSKTPVAGRPGSAQYNAPVLGTLKIPEAKPRGKSVVLPFGAADTYNVLMNSMSAKPKSK